MNILNKISAKNLILNKKRTIATIMGIVLSTALMIGIGLLFSTLKETTIREIKKSSGSHHAIIYNLNKEELEKLKKNENIKNIITNQSFGYGETEKKSVYQIFGLSKEFLNILEIKRGRLPKNQNEIVVFEGMTNATALSLGEKLKLNVGEIKEYCQFKEDQATTLKELQIVGVVKREYLINTECSELAITTEGEGLYNAYIEYKSVKEARAKTRLLVASLGTKDTDSRIKFNTALLEVSGESKFDNFDALVASLMAITLSIIAAGCTIVIYNSFAISIIERKKQFGLLNSIGATKKQIKKTVYFEGFVTGLIGITLGIISAFIGIGIVILVANNLLKDVMETSFALSVYPLYIIIPIIFMILVIIASSLIPAFIASKLSPIDSIKMKDDIKIKAKKLKVNGLVKKIFGFEATIAFKNMKRNKRKYRITILALFVSISMFIVFSSYMDYLLKTQEMSGFNKPYDIKIEYLDQNKKYDQVEKMLKKTEADKIVTLKRRYALLSDSRGNSVYNQDYLKAVNPNNNEDVLLDFTIIEANEEVYQNLLKKYNKKPGTSFVYNYYEAMDMGGSELKLESGKKMKELEELQLISRDKLYFNEAIDLKINNVSYINERIDEISDLSQYGIFVIVPKEVYNSFAKQIAEKVAEENKELVLDHIMNDEYIITINTDKHEEITKSINEQAIDLGVLLNAYNVSAEVSSIQKVLLLFKILLYGFVGLVASIGVTSVFNTLNTSIILRRREFAMLRSVGLSPKGFNKMIIFETLIFTVKSMLYSIPFSIFIVYQIHRSMSGVVSMDSVLIPYKSIFISLIMVLLIVFATIMYSTRTIKKANILESLKDENI